MYGCHIEAHMCVPDQFVIDCLDMDSYSPLHLSLTLPLKSMLNYGKAVNLRLSLKVIAVNICPVFHSKLICISNQGYI